MTIPEIKAECRRSIALADEASEGPWEASHYDFETTRVYGPLAKHVADVPSFPAVKAPDALHIAHSRTFSPAAAKALLIAIDVIEFRPHVDDCRVNGREIAKGCNCWKAEALDQIAAQWSAKG